ncbi:MAG: O-antigen ligase family protein [Patescibacteria group bacterium]|nr:O-antigen ligase family protein [Patescibacteria group bacterium]
MKRSLPGFYRVTMTQKNNSWPLIIFSALVMVPLLYFLIFTNPSWIQIAQIAVLIVILPIFFLYEELGFFALLVLRPALDVFSEDVLIKIGQFTLNLSSFIGLMTIVWVALYLLRHHVKIWKQPLFWPYFIFVLLSIISLIYTPSTSATIRESVRIASIFFVYLMAGIIITQYKQYNKFLKAIALSSIIPLGVGFYQLLTGSGLSFAGVNNRVYGTLAHPNAFASYLVLLFGIGISYYFSRHGQKKPLWLMPGLIIAIIFLLLTYTRGGWIGFSIIVVLFGLRYYRKVLFILFGLAIILILFGPALNRFFYTTFDYDFSRQPIIGRLLDRNPESESSIDWRFKVWTEMSRKITEQPILGYGLGSFPVIRQQYVKGLYESAEAHNDYLRLVIELGFVGAFIYLVLLTKLLYNLLKQYLKKKNTSQKAWLYGGMAVATAFILMSLSDNVLQGTANMWLLWAWLATLQNLSKFQY